MTDAETRLNVMQKRDQAHYHSMAGREQDPEIARVAAYLQVYAELLQKVNDARSEFVAFSNKLDKKWSSSLPGDDNDD